MSIYDFTLRFKKMAREEYNTVKLESKVSQKNVMLFKIIDDISMVMKRHEQNIQLCSKKVTEMSEKIKVLNELTEKESKQLVSLKDAVQQLQIENDGKYKEIFNERQQVLMETSLLRVFEDASKTFINEECLPKIIQGVRISGSKWTPFRTNSSNYTSPYLDYWRSIILRDCKDEDNSSGIVPL